jgi:hypothetical protein
MRSRLVRYAELDLYIVELIEALCIDQRGLIEKGHYVGFGGSICKNSEHILVYIGDSDDDAKYAIEVIYSGMKLYISSCSRMVHACSQ